MIARVLLWGRTIGAVSLEAGRDYAAFQYDPAFARSGAVVEPFLSDPFFRLKRDRHHITAIGKRKPVDETARWRVTIGLTALAVSP